MPKLFIMLRFYIVSIIVNAGIVFLSFEISELLIEETIMYNSYSKLLAKLSVISDLSMTYFFYRSLFWLLSPLTILVIKKYQLHWLAYVILNIIIVGLYTVYNYNRVIWERLLYEDLFFISMGFSISILIHFSQMLLGKKLLPTLYKEH